MFPKGNQLYQLIGKGVKTGDKIKEILGSLRGGAAYS